ncbi:protein tipE isoform X1 [Galleria mellonella]|uniref:Protein tipE isoform X1 n=2 Tax=Galleria mellonella TaxID=7137 RepID=A0ABM3MRQ2_GALME|nr:protein tipE isoform X1 [Galleria mellonella]XP_052754037.1 protein tipE isoform X1 [Galleria mellonella]XP_052754038.1 protein tipE isoform X1 [Galleria mellonella]XP_052754039.1 protein tipE isoform X1 [Galleria mellonella]XP_052754040.1 protein tipE isoform X1 [Galleria mellonella]XP_052754041.1 protein tipE isoform X1 [Galleria mellonella]XP_052754042.1 protein tipE isoform X1 [Galleria mellonella]XP_052754043.1 protein tipE isoform X1 [Galleria mellonella]XP_052754044.1 protein tipE
MADEEVIPPTFQEKLLFYTTASFVLLATFSLFAFLFLVPFVIEPAFTTIFMQFDPVAALCVTAQVKHLVGASNCSWASCREGCTKDLFECTQIRVNYKLGDYPNITATDVENLVRVERALRKDYEYENYEFSPPEMFEDKDLPDAYPTGLQGNDSEWYFTGARLFPNVKGCGYPPILNCTIFYGKYRPLGNNYTCYYSRVDPGLVITELDMWQNTLNLVYAMAIPIPSFIISVIYLTFAYFKIYNTEEESEQEPLKNDAEAMATGDDEKPTTPGSDTFREDLARFGHQLKMQLANDNPKEGFESNSPPISNSASLSGTKSSFVNA